MENLTREEEDRDEDEVNGYKTGERRGEECEKQGRDTKRVSTRAASMEFRRDEMRSISGDDGH